MTIRLTLAGGNPIELDDELITLGSDPACTVCVADPSVQPKHAVLRSIDGNWLIEVSEAVAVYLGEIPKKAHMVRSGDIIGLSIDGPLMKIVVLEDVPQKSSADHAQAKPGSRTMSTRPASSAGVRTPKQSDVIPLMDSDDNIPVALPSSKPPSSAIISTSKSPSKVSRPAAKSVSSAGVASAKSSGNVKVVKDPSSAVVSTSRPPSTTTIATSSKSSVILPGSQAKARSSDGSMPVKKSKSTAVMPALGSEDDTAVGVPMLRRITTKEIPIQSLSEDEEASSYGGTGKRRRSAEEEREIKWIKAVIIKSAIGGVLAIVAITVVWELVKMVSKPSPSPAGTASISRPFERSNDAV